MFGPHTPPSFEALELTNAVHVGHSTGGGEVAPYIGRYGDQAGGQGGAHLCRSTADAQDARQSWWAPDRGVRRHPAGTQHDRSQFFKDLSGPFFGANRPENRATQGMRDAFWFQGMQCGMKGAIDCIKAFSETDFTEDLKKFDVPTLIIHGDDDQIVPIGASALLSSKLVKDATLKIYQGAPHGLMDTHRDEINADLLAFLKA